MSKFSSPSLIVSITALGVSLGGAGYSATGGNFILGKANIASSETRLTSKAGSPYSVFRLVNNASQPALGIVVKPGIAPMVVNSQTKVANLNADLVDGLDSGNFARAARFFTLSAAPGGFSREIPLPDGIAALVTATQFEGTSHVTILRVGDPTQSFAPIFTRFVGLEFAGGGTITSGTFDESSHQFGGHVIDIDANRTLSIVTSPLGIRLSNKDTQAAGANLTVLW